ncbi:MAG: SpoIIE family protein phosphatase [Armatimonadetes bacterium]|nr:SpoIIE family protein phosphatase [Armatimonadota bacterium]
MKKGKAASADAADLRRRAEEKLKATGAEAHPPIAEPDALRLVRELQVHQIELELQNDELQQAKVDADASLEWYTDLYDYAPLGYFTLDRQGNIRQVNLTGSSLLGIERSRLVNERFSLFVSPETLPVFNAFFESAFETQTKQICEVVLQTEAIAPIYVRIEAAVPRVGEECRIAVVDITERRQMEDAQSFLLQCGWPGSGEDFFQTLARYLADTLSMDFVCIDRLTEDCLAAQTVAIYFNGKFEDNVAYTLKDTPCGDVVRNTICSFPRDVRHLFPRDKVLQEMMAEGYVGTTLWSSQGQPIGLIAIISRKPLTNTKPAELILKLVAIRAAGELERTQAEDALAQSHEQMTQILESISDAFFTLDRDWRFNYVNNEAEHILLKSREELIGTRIWDQFPEAVGTMFQTEYERSVREAIAVQFESYYPPFDQWFEIRAYPYEGGISVYFQDCSERHAAQDILTHESERSAHIADVLQQALIPPQMPIQPEGYEIAAKYQPALSESEVCGDFYDLIDLGDGKIGIVIGDIVGKGLPAASRVAAVRHTIRSYAFLYDQPSRVMTLVSDALFRDITTENDMLTAFFAMLDTRTGRMAYTNAGHEPPLVRHSDGSVEPLAMGGPMFDGLGRHVYSEDSLSFKVGDLLVLVTDGITESRKVHDSKLFGTEGIIRCLSRNANASAEDIASKLLEDATAFANGALHDDVALVVIRKVDACRSQ